ncbi:MAG: hypothetical protein BWY14_00209 [Parcubacteria group bacterium ADurb.Bin192]|nr:MAG: hypothetical protein BWY14_00209 [Parcubacteria group bacterium ADurb.Bin192]
MSRHSQKIIRLVGIPIVVSGYVMDVRCTLYVDTRVRERRTVVRCTLYVIVISPMVVYI